MYKFKEARPLPVSAENSSIEDADRMDEALHRLLEEGGLLTDDTAITENNEDIDFSALDYGKIERGYYINHIEYKVESVVGDRVFLVPVPQNGGAMDNDEKKLDARKKINKALNLLEEECGIELVREEIARRASGGDRAPNQGMGTGADVKANKSSVVVTIGSSKKQSFYKSEAEKNANTIARLRATLAELCKIKLASAMPDDDDAVRHARNLVRTAERLRERGVIELPKYALEPIRNANRLVKARQRQKRGAGAAP